MDKEFTIQKKLGDGAFSSVYAVKRISDGVIYAMKKVKMGKLSEKEKQNALNEVRILASINHPNVIGYKEAFFESSSGNLCIVMELCDSGDLLQAIEKHKKNKTKFTEKQIWNYFIQTVRGLKALHDLKICHRDIKCANLFLTKNGMAKLGDLNVSKVAKKGMMHTQTGTPYYASPEVWKDKPYDNKSDIWSLGCVLYEMITLLPPFRANSMQGLASKVTKGIFEPISSRYSADLHQMIKSCLQVSCQNRPSCEQILATPGLLNHLTGTLEELTFDEESEAQNDNLLQTIRCPRDLGQITERLPKAQYQHRHLKRSASMNIDATSDLKSKLQIKDLHVVSQAAPKRVEDLQRGNLATIDEDQVENDTIDFSKMGQRNQRVAQSRQQVKRNMRVPSAVRNGSQIASARPHYQSEQRHHLPSQRLPPTQDSKGSRQQSINKDKMVERSQERPPMNPRSADVYAHKNKAFYSQQHQQLPSDQEDASTNVSSRSQLRRNQINSLNAAPIQYNHQHGLPASQTPQASMGKANDLKNYLPQIDSRPTESSRYGEYEPQSYRSRLGYRKQMESAGISRALGIAAPRYEGVGNAIRMARELSKENLQNIGNHHLKMERGPCPRHIPRNPSIPSVVSESERQSLQYAKDLERGLQAVYGHKRRLEPQPDIFDNGAGAYQPPSRYRERSHNRHSAVYQRII